jgi:hypothetical protein
MRVAISGLWKGEDVISSRIATARDPRDVIAGDLRRSGLSLRIGNLEVRGPGLVQVPDGTFLTAIGAFEPDAGRFRSTSLRTERFTGAAGPLRRLRVEGFLEPVDSAPGYRVAGLGHSFARNLALADFAADRVLFIGPYTGRFAANRATRLPEFDSARRDLLRQMSANR